MKGVSIFKRSSPQFLRYQRSFLEDPNDFYQDSDFGVWGGYFLTFAGALLINFIKHFQRILNPFKKIRIFAKISSNLFCQLTKEKLTTTLPQNQPFTLYSKTSTPKSRSKFLFFHELFFNFFTPFQKLLQKNQLSFLTKITIKNLKLKTTYTALPTPTPKLYNPS